MTDWVLSRWTICGLCVASLSGCVALETRPGHPYSYKTPYYNVKAQWPTVDNPECGAGGTNPQQADMIIASGCAAPPSYISTDIPRQIWKARGVAWNMQLRYQAAWAKASDVQDLYAIPLFGLAIAAAATGIGHASTVAVAAVGLAATSAAGLYEYDHPQTDAATDLLAAKDLLCIVSVSQPLESTSDIALLLDKAALQDALNTLTADAGDLLITPNPNAQEQTAREAVTAAQKTANDTIKALNAAITAYNSLPSAIYGTVSAIDMAAKTAGGRAINTDSIDKSAQTSGTNKAGKDQASGALESAKAKVAAASTGGAKTEKSKTSAAVKKVVAPKVKKGGEGTTPLLDAAEQDTKPAVEAAPNAAGKTDQQQRTSEASAQQKSKAGSLRSVLTTGEISDLTAVTVLAQEALNDIPPNDTSASKTNSFSDIATAIYKCAGAETSGAN